MTSLQIVLLILLGTFAFSLVLAGCASLQGRATREKGVVASDWLSLVLVATREWKKEDRTELLLIWSGVVCAAAGAGIAYLG